MLMKFLMLLLVQAIAVFIYCCGFFPQKNVLRGDAHFLLEPVLQNQSEPVFDKLVLVIIDALRSDFLFDQSMSNFTFVHSLLNSGEAWGYTAFSNPPTVTLPRLKGITTGSTPNFLDAILNVAEDDSSSNLKDQDSWLKQFAIHGKKMRFFGDDTWLKLFPLEFFQEFEGTNSFFVSDFEQVDWNVTRHLPDQLTTQKDWDVLILHYLGLDHIGHKGGARSIFMPAKQTEMDSIVKRLYENVDQNTLICIMGDHGMNDAGNHGGSSPGETSAGLVMMSKKLAQFPAPKAQRNISLPLTLPLQNDEVSYDYLTKVQQVDFVPTLASLFNVPIPKNNVGIIIRDFLPLLNTEVASIKVKENYHQMASLLGQNADINVEQMDQLFMLMKNLQNVLTKSATNYKYPILALGFGILVITTAVSLCFATTTMRLSPPFFLTLLISLLLGLSTFGSSFVEEEHQIWWWVVTGVLLLSQFYLRTSFRTHFICLACVRLIRAWNNSGQKNTHNNTLFDILKANPQLQWYLNVLTIFVVGMRGTLGDTLSFIISFSLSGLCVSYKVSWAVVNHENVPGWLKELVFKTCLFFTSSDTNVFGEALVPMAQFFFQCVVVSIITKIVALRMGLTRSNIHNCISLFLMFQSPSPNIPLFLIFEVLQSALTQILIDHYSSNDYFISLTSLILQYFTFFQFGGTNSIASVDLSNAYNGVPENYNIYFVGFMMFVSNFAPTIYWSLYKSQFPDMNNHKWRSFAQRKITLLVYHCVVGCFLLAACYVFRSHLFIWSVFSPKLCYFAAWNIFMNLIVECGLESIIVATNNL
ncbi:related to GPI ethanolamine phosphate transferase 2 [Zygosaccharomyces bailii]|nr:related to GPI ethanolamine phosphate transferase 2 [Zygosaccharomyces bailii]